MYRYFYYDPPVHDKFNLRAEPLWLGKWLGFFTWCFWATTFYDKYAHSLPVSFLFFNSFWARVPKQVGGNKKEFGICLVLEIHMKFNFGPFK